MAHRLLDHWLMIEALFSQNNYLAAKKMLDVTTLRHQAIASNLANIETPQYKRIDVAPSFAEQLNQAISQRNASAIQRLQPQLAEDPTAFSGRMDGNTVQLEKEMLRMNQNTLEHTFSSRLVTGTLLRLRMAITGRS